MNNSLTRVMATINGSEKDRTACALTLSVYGAGLINCPLKEYYSNASLYAQGQQAIRETFAPDIILGPFSLPIYGKAFGGEIRYFADHPPNLLTPAIEDIEKGKYIVLPDIDSEPALCYLRESIRLLTSQADNQYPIAAIALSPVDLPIMIFGLENWLDILLFEQDIASYVLERCIEFFCQWTDALFSDGATCIILPMTFANLKISTPKLLHETVLGVMQQAFSKSKGPLILHHTGTSIQHSLEHIKDLPNVLGFCVGKEDSLEECREIIGPEKVLLGNIDGPSLLKRKPEKIFEHTMRILDDRSLDKHFILTTSAADIDINTPPECIHAIINAVKTHRGIVKV